MALVFSAMPCVTVAVIPARVFRDGIKQPGFLYVVSNEEARRHGNLGLYDVWKQPGVNPFPVSIAEWVGTLAGTNSIDPIYFQGDLRDLLTAVDSTYIMYYFTTDLQRRHGVVYVQSSDMARDCCVVYAVDIRRCEDWFEASRFDYLRYVIDDGWR